MNSSSRQPILLPRATAFVWLAVLPALATGLVLRYLVPTVSEAAGTWASGLARAADRYPVASAVLVFLFATAVVRELGSSLVGAPPDAREDRRGALGLVVTVAVAALAALGLRAFVGVYRIEGESMLPTVLPDDVLVGGRFGHGFAPGGAKLPARGDLVVFEKPRGTPGPDLLVKRVIGLPGDRIRMRGAQPMLNGEIVPACDAGMYLYVAPDSASSMVGKVFVEFLDGRPHLALTTLQPGWEGEYLVKPGEVFVLGDNRNESSDSRAWGRGKGAGLPIASIDGRAERLLFGRKPSGSADLDLLLRSPELQVRFRGMDGRELTKRVAECLEHPPTKSEAP